MRITHTPIGQEYGWDTLAEVDGDLLVNNHQAMRRIVENPEQFPDADHAAAERKANMIEDFLLDYSEPLLARAEGTAA